LSLACALAGLRLPSQGGEPIEGRLGAHVALCLACQAEQSRYRKLKLWLGDLRERAEQPPADLALVVLPGNDPLQAMVGSPAHQVSRTTVAAAAGAAVVAAAAVLVGIRLSRAA